jgi:hypothetical protein
LESINLFPKRIISNFGEFGKEFRLGNNKGFWDLIDFWKSINSFQNGGFLELERIGDSGFN